MKTKTVTVREGEKLGPVDWEYNFEEHSWDNGGSINPRVISRKVELLKKIESNPEKYEVTSDGGVPKYGWGRVTWVGMWDGWPSWKPTPYVFIKREPYGMIQTEKIAWWSITEIREVEDE